jgi:hypothetical protein
MAVSLAALPKGHEFKETKFELTPQWVAEYVSAVEDQTAGTGVVPPLALATLSIRSLFEQAALPDGAIHVSQETHFWLEAPPAGAIVAKARIASRGERAGWVLMGVELEVEDEARTTLMNGRATITFPAPPKDAGHAEH